MEILLLHERLSSFSKQDQSGDSIACRSERLTGFEHRVHDDGELPRHRNSCPFEADPLPQLQPPLAQVPVGICARQDHGYGLIEQPSQMSVAAPGDMAILVTSPD